MSGSDQKNDTLPQRLCSEIQLFDLCDLDSCKSKNGRFCTDPSLLGSFEKIAEDKVRTPERFISEDGDDLEADDDDETDGEFDMENFEAGEGDDWEDEE